MMLFKNRTDRHLRWRVGTGPGSWVDYEADPGEFAIIPEGYRDQAKREGFTPVDELPADEQPDISVARQHVTLGKKQKKVFFEDEDGERLERAVPSQPLTGAGNRPRQPTPPTRLPGVSARPQIDMSAAPPDGPMALDNVPSLPDLPLPPAEDPAGAAPPAGAVLPPPDAPEGIPVPETPGTPGPVTERDTKPDKPGAKGAKK